MSNHTHTSRNKNADKKTLYRMAKQNFRFILFSIIAAAIIATGEAAQTPRRMNGPIFSTTAIEGSAR